MSNAQFKRDYAAIIKRAGDKAETVVRQSMIAIGKGLVEKSPVGNPDLWSSPAPEGYVGGRFKNNWQFGVSSINSDTSRRPDGAGGGSLASIVAGTAAWKPGQTIFISNSLPYAYRIEYEGWSTQAPAGVVRLTVLDFQQSVRKAAQGLK